MIDQNPHDIIEIKKLFGQFQYQIDRKYSFKQQSTNLKKVFELQYRIIELGLPEIVDSNLEQFIKKSDFNNPVSRLFISMLISFIAAFLNRNVIFFRSKVASKHFEKHIFQKLKKSKFQKLGVLSFDNSTSTVLKYIFSFCWVYDLLERSTLFSCELKKQNCKSAEELIFLSNSKSFNTKLNDSLLKDIEFICWALKKLKIKSIVIHTDQNFFGVMIALAARKCKIRVSVIAHGNFVPPFINAVLPLHADKLFVWSNWTKVLINECAGSDCAELVEGLKYGIIERNRNPSNILIVCCGLAGWSTSKIVDFKNSLDLIRLKFSEENIVYCTHPSGSPNELVEYANALNFKVSKKSTYKEAKSAKLILGGDTSFLLEAIISGIPTFQLKEHCLEPKLARMEGVPQISNQGLKKNHPNSSNMNSAKEQNFGKKFLDFVVPS